jgi:protein-arginine kinase activator protein McsA
MEEKKIEKLYELLDRAEKEKDTEAAAALRWAIFSLES